MKAVRGGRLWDGERGAQHPDSSAVGRASAWILN